MTKIGFIRGSGLPVPTKTLSTIDSQIPWRSTLNAKQNTVRKLRPAILWYLIVQTCGSLERPAFHLD